MRALAPAAVAALALAAAGPADAKRITFGSTLDHPPTATSAPATCDVTGADWDTGPCTRVAIGFDATGSVGGRVKAPAKGTIKRIRLRSGIAGQVRMVLARVRDVDREDGTGEGRLVSRGKLLHVKGRGTRENRPTESFKANIPVRRGDYLAFSGSSFGAVACSAGDMEQLVFDPPLALGEGFRFTSEFGNCTLLVQATIETG